MSYSINVSATDAASAKIEMAAKLDEVIGAQPAHAADRGVVVATVGTLIDLLDAPKAGQSIEVSVNGWLNWSNPEGDPKFTAAALSATVTLK